MVQLQKSLISKLFWILLPAVIAEASFGGSINAPNFEFYLGKTSISEAEVSWKCDFGVLTTGEAFSGKLKFIARDGYRITVRDGETDCGCLSGKVAPHENAPEVIVNIEMSPVFSEQTIRRKVISDVEMISASDGSRHQIKAIAIIELKVRNPITFDVDKLILDSRRDATGKRKDSWTFDAMNFTGTKANELAVEGSFPGKVSIEQPEEGSGLRFVVAANRALEHGEMFRLSFRTRGHEKSSKDLGAVSLVAYDSGLTRVLPSALVASEANGYWDLEFRVLLPRTKEIDLKSVEIEVAINGVAIDRDSILLSRVNERLYKINLVRCKTPLNGSLSGVVKGQSSSVGEIVSFQFETTCHYSEKIN